MFSRFFIERPIFASVISIVIVIAGVVTVGGDGGEDGLLTLTIADTELAQDTPARGYFDVYGVITGPPLEHILLVTGRWECVGTTVNPAVPV